MSVKIPTWHTFFHRVFKYVDEEKEEAEKIIENESVCVQSLGYAISAWDFYLFNFRLAFIIISQFRFASNLFNFERSVSFFSLTL